MGVGKRAVLNALVCQPNFNLPSKFLPSIVGVGTLNDTHELNEIFLLNNFGDAAFSGRFSEDRWPRPKA
jgi:hypothetical protein